MDDFESNQLIECQIFIIFRIIFSLIAHNYNDLADLDDQTKSEQILDKYIQKLSWELSNVLQKMFKRQYITFAQLLSEIGNAKMEYSKSHKIQFDQDLTGIIDEKELIKSEIESFITKEKSRREGMKIADLEQLGQEFFKLKLAQNQLQTLEEIEQKLLSNNVNDSVYSGNEQLRQKKLS